MKACDFCADDVKDDEPMAMIYGAETFSGGPPLLYTSDGAWLACPTCAAFIRQYDAGERRAKDNLASRCLNKYRRKYGLPDGVRPILFSEIRALHDAFWAHRKGEPVPYTTLKSQEG